MSKQANARLIGAFVVGGLVLAFVLLALLGSFRLFEDRQTFVLYFKSSVNNLNVGAPVKWKGVPVGRVNDIRIRWNQDALSSEVPVFVELDLDRLSLALDEPEVLRRQVEAGLRAQLQFESLISGLLFIELDYMPETGDPRYIQRSPVYPELPTVASPFDEIGDVASEVAANLSNVDFNGISEQLKELLERTNTLLEEVDAPGVSRSIKSAANAVTSLASSPETTELIRSLAATSESLRRLSDNLATASGPLTEDAHATLAQATQTLEALEATARQLRVTLGPDSQLIYTLESTLQELSAAARAAAQLTDFLERNPRAIITGRPPPTR